MGLRMYCFSRWCLRRIYRVFWRMEIINRDAIPMSGGLIVVSNHASFLDPTLVGCALDRPLYYMARKTLFDNPVFGWYIREHLAFPLDREGDSRAALRAFGNKLEEGLAVLMFPEGTRTITGKLSEIKDGVGMISVRNNAAVLPTFIWGSYQSWPKGQRLPWPHKLKVFFGDPIIPQSDLAKSERKAEQKRMTGEVNAAMQRLEAEAWAGHEPPVPLNLPPPAT